MRLQLHVTDTRLGGARRLHFLSSQLDSVRDVVHTALEFSPDRSSLITAAAADGTIRSWTLPLPAQKPAAGVEPIKPAWEFKSPDGAGVLQLARLSQEQGLVALTAVGTSIVRLRWDGTAADPISSPGGVLKRIEVAANGSAFWQRAMSDTFMYLKSTARCEKLWHPWPGSRQQDLIAMVRSWPCAGLSLSCKW